MSHDYVASAAGRWFGLRAEYERLSRFRAGIRIARQLAFDAVTFSLGALDLDPKRDCEVIVYRLDDGDVVAKYAYSRLGDASNHVRDLYERLRTEHVYDFCRELNVPPNLVDGPGVDLPANLADVWVEVPARR